MNAILIHDGTIKLYDGDELVATLNILKRVKRKKFGVCKDGTILFRRRKYNGKVYWVSASGNARYPVDEVTPVKESIEDAVLRTIKEFLSDCNCETIKLKSAIYEEIYN